MPVKTAANAVGNAARVGSDARNVEEVTLYVQGSTASRHRHAARLCKAQEEWRCVLLVWGGGGEETSSRESFWRVLMTSSASSGCSSA
eukprot:2303979-Rhodomonas_salina.1